MIISKYYLISYKGVYYRIAKEDWCNLSQEQREYFILEQTNISINDYLLTTVIDIYKFFER